MIVLVSGLDSAIGYKKPFEAGVFQHDVDDELEGERTGFERHRSQCGGKGGDAFYEGTLGGSKRCLCDSEVRYWSRVKAFQKLWGGEQPIMLGPQMDPQLGDIWHEGLGGDRGSTGIAKRAHSDLDPLEQVRPRAADPVS